MMGCKRIFVVALLVACCCTSWSLSFQLIHKKHRSTALRNRNLETSLRVVSSVGIAESGEPSQMSTSTIVELRKKPSLQTWIKRLDTKEDKNRLHKISGAGFVLSSTVILLAGAATGFHSIPAWLQPFDSLLLGSTTIQCVTSIDMAFNHRKGQPVVREQFVAMALLVLLSTTAAEMFTPFTPPFLCNKFISDQLLLAMGSTSLAYTATGLHSKQKLIDDLRKQRSTDLTPNLGKFVEESLIQLSTSIPIIQVGATLAVFLDPAHDRQWILDFAEKHAGVSVFFYMQVLSNVCFMYSALVLTLYDKKLISKAIEAQLLSVLLTTPLIVTPSVLLLS